MTIQGTLEHSALEGGTWVFRTKDGDSYQLEGLPSNLQKDGAKLELEGSVDEGMMTIGMMGSVFQVSKARSL
ncbi:MAG: hypothetical protein J0I12_12830 [Candidatus Eremiobacteraeota bacterium]|nr:hypothetical protein [Candidatus Eremiobacteraeota bacterium]